MTMMTMMTMMMMMMTMIRIRRNMSRYVRSDRRSQGGLRGGRAKPAGDRRSLAPPSVAARIFS